MKRLENNTLYVDIEDLVYLELIKPISDFEAKKYYRAKKDSIPFNNPKSIEFFMNNENILDYNLLINLSLEELNKMLIKIEERIFYYEHQFFNLVSKDFLAKDEERKRELRMLKHNKETLQKIYQEKKYNELNKRL